MTLMRAFKKVRSKNITQYKPPKCTFYEFIFYFLILLCLLHVSNPRVHLPEDGYIYSYDMVSFRYIEHIFLPTRLFILMRVKHTIP